MSLRYESQIFKSVEMAQNGGLDCTAHNVKIGPNLEDKSVFSGDMKIVIDLDGDHSDSVV